ncbi:MAG: 8-amino-7-oxononanoate synthase [Alphaproteobacteria bacterium]|uniref:8-amino-7-ketopelargonate synthase n=1 Tax=Candidatus Nitrobium versatile TaxID=2884831 RepID=A0A953M323_9BACT|nr:8-amino-7-oxononanoate synthase [Candidatus Nitrobium versatile]
MFADKLGELLQENLLRFVRDREAPPGRAADLSRIFIDGNELINFASNDYLGLAGHSTLTRAAREAMETFGFGSGASRLLAGGTSLHGELERAVASFKGTESALVFNSGYAANTGALPSLAEEGDTLFSDELNHASIIDGCRLSRAKTVIYRHRDPDHLAELLEREGGRRNVVVTDTVFSMDGDIAPLGDIYTVCARYNARAGASSVLLYIDDAHGTGVLGDGKGALSHFGIGPEPWILQMGTFSKALGSFGAFIAAERDTVQWLLNTARGFIYSTALPAAVIAASMAALQTVREEPLRVKKLWENRARLHEGLQAEEFDTLQSETPILPIVMETSGEALRFAEQLGKHRIYAPAIRPPTVAQPRIRLTVTAAHTFEDIDALLGALASIRKGRRV